MGDGRWFDTLTGHALQPNIGATLLHLPQSLNRYTSIATGHTGTQFTSHQVSVVTFVGSAFLANTISTVAGTLVNTVADKASYLGYVSLTANSKILQRAGYTSLLKRVAAPGKGKSTQYVSVLVLKESDNSFGVVSKFGVQETLSIANLERNVASKRWPVKNVNFNKSLGGKIGSALTSYIGQFGVGFALNVALSWNELADPWRDYHYSTGQSVVQNIVTFSGAAASVGVGVGLGALTTNLLAGSAWAGPVGIATVVIGGVAVAVTWEYAVKPFVSWASVNVFNRVDPYQRYRRLEPRGNN